jgi:NADPH2:quinone reductase
MGLAAVAVGRHLGLEVVAAASSDAKLAAARAAGAHACVKLDRAAPDLTAAGAVDIVFDPVGAGLAAPALRTLRWNGRYLIIGFVGGAPARVPLNRLLLKGVELVGVRAGEAGRQDPEAGRRHIAAVQALAEQAAWRPHVGMAVPFAEAPAAFTAMRDGTLVGKAVVRVVEPAA